jgi:hypothetical protein
VNGTFSPQIGWWGPPKEDFKANCEVACFAL